MSKIIALLSFVIGFIVASHWDYGRNLVREVSPFAPKTLTQKIKIMTGNGAKTKAKKAIEAVKETVEEQKESLAN